MNIGDKIPEILGIDQNGKEIKRDDFKGKKINILGEININKWQGKITTSFIIEDILMNDK